MARKTVELFYERDIGVVHDIDEHPDNGDFHLHHHENMYEILLLLSGDVEYRAEGNVYRLVPQDIVFARPFELHVMYSHSDTKYERLIIYIGVDYFKRNNCERFLDIFENRPIGVDNCITKKINDDALPNCMKRIEEYADNKEYDVVEYALYEFLYLLNVHRESSDNIHTSDERVRRMIVYINDHLSDELNLDVIANEFYIAKNYMCRLFKKHTGYTINQYITYKRILLAQELYRGGSSLMQASMEAGFNSYANFYKAYVKQEGESPKHLMR